MFGPTSKPKGYEERDTDAYGEVRVNLLDDRRIRGHAIVFNAVSHDLGGFREIIRPEAVDRTLREAEEVFALWNHDNGEPIASTHAGNLILTKESRGLAVNIHPPQSYPQYRLEMIENRTVRGMSFGFFVLEQDWSKTYDDGLPLRYVNDMKLREVSIVTRPAYPQTDVALRALQEYRERHGISIDWHQKVHKTRMAR